LARLQNLRPGTYTAVRAGGAAWLLFEWTIFFLIALAVTILMIADSSDPELLGDDRMLLIDWLDFGAFVLVAGAIGVLTFAIGVSMLTNLGGELKGWERGLLKALVVANLVGAAWYTISLASTDTPYFDGIVILGFILSAIVALTVSYARRAPAS
jgi:hypothetical protein